MSAAKSHTHAACAGTESEWLSIDEQQAWKAVLTVILQLPGTLDAQLLHDAGITLFDYVVLSALSMEPEHKLRMSSLARLSNGSLSRLSNVVKRFEDAGWVRREPDPCDGRYTVATLTDSGYDLVVAAAPGHVGAVRRHVIDPLNATQLRALTAIGRRLPDNLTTR